MDVLLKLIKNISNYNIDKKLFRTHNTKTLYSNKEKPLPGSDVNQKQHSRVFIVHVHYTSFKCSLVRYVVHHYIKFFNIQLIYR